MKISLSTPLGEGEAVSYPSPYVPEETCWSINIPLGAYEHHGSKSEMLRWINTYVEEADFNESPENKQGPIGEI
tara:strand:- start:101 stop:322 length:222 start_codon:yes stop_codon:yes gene_type:complete